MSLINYLDDMAKAIKEKSGYQGKMKYSEMPEKIRELAYQDPIAEFEDCSVILKDATDGTWFGENNNVAILDLGAPAPGKNPIYTRYDRYEYGSSGEVYGPTIAVFDNGRTLNISNDQIDSSGYVYSICGKWTNPNQHYTITTSSLADSHGVLFNSYSDAPDTYNLISRDIPKNYDSETVIIHFTSSGIDYNYSQADSTSIFFPVEIPVAPVQQPGTIIELNPSPSEDNNSGGREYNYRTLSGNGSLYILQDLAGESGEYYASCAEPQEGFAFLSTSGMTSDNVDLGYNFIQYLDSSGSPTQATTITPGNYTIFCEVQSSGHQWKMAPYEGYNIENGYLYYCSESSGELHLTQTDSINSGGFYQYNGGTDFTSLSDGLWYLDTCNSTYNSISLGSGDFYRYDGSGTFTSFTFEESEFDAYFYSRGWDSHLDMPTLYEHVFPRGTLWVKLNNSDGTLTQVNLPTSSNPTTTFSDGSHSYTITYNN